MNLEGSRNVFEATAPPARSASSTPRRSPHTATTRTTRSRSPRTFPRAAPPRTTTPRRRPRSRRCWPRRSTARRTDGYVFRPCIVAGPQAPLLIDSLPYTQISERLPAPSCGLLDGVPILKPVLPDPGVPFQLVHHDDVATRCARRCSDVGAGAYNLARPVG